MPPNRIKFQNFLGILRNPLTEGGTAPLLCSPCCSCLRDSTNSYGAGFNIPIILAKPLTCDSEKLHNFQQKFLTNVRITPADIIMSILFVDAEILIKRSFHTVVTKNWKQVSSRNIKAIILRLPIYYTSPLSFYNPERTYYHKTRHYVIIHIRTRPIYD